MFLRYQCLRGGYIKILCRIMIYPFDYASDFAAVVVVAGASVACGTIKMDQSPVQLIGGPDMRNSLR